MKQLKDLPNTNGFKFTGIDLDGERIPCVVKLDPVGNHGVYDQRDGSPCFFRLYGWQPSETEGWRPIETAPADTDVLLYCPDRHYTNPERVELGQAKNTKGGSAHSWATHWMPVPSAPSTKDGALP